MGSSKICNDDMVGSMGDKKHKKDKKKIKDKCCDKYAKKGKHCSRCPLQAECKLPE
jgi:hypothetical protein